MMPQDNSDPNPKATQANSTARAPEIRRAELSDAGGIAEIYNHEVLHEATVFDLRPRSLEEQTQWLIERSGAFPVLVAITDDRVSGFASLSPYRTRPAYRTTVESSVYVARDAQGEGLGRILLESLIEAARHHGFHTLVARITGGNEASIVLHHRLGFESVGVEREVGRKFGKWLDSVIMQYML